MPAFPQVWLTTSFFETSQAGVHGRMRHGSGSVAALVSTVFHVFSSHTTAV